MCPIVAFVYWESYGLNMSSPSAIIAICHSGIKNITFAWNAVHEYSDVCGTTCMGWYKCTAYIFVEYIKVKESVYFYTLQWRHNEHDSVSNHQPDDCFLNRLFRCRWKKTSKPRVTGLCAGNSPGTGEFPVQMASNAENDVIMITGNLRMGHTVFLEKGYSVIDMIFPIYHHHSPTASHRKTITAANNNNCSVFYWPTKYENGSGYAWYLKI